jgi:uncharacterized protein (TIGR00730 family)
VTEPRSGGDPHSPATLDEELFNAESAEVATTQTDPARLARMHEELARGFELLEGIGPAVSVFGSARVTEQDPEYELARLTARKLGEAGFAVITGGGPGVMEAANRGAQEAGVKSVGLNIDLPFEQPQNAYVNYGVDFHYFFTRKVMFVRYASASVVFPGGFGTLDELFETLTLIQTGKIRHFPVVLNVPEYWAGLLEWLRDRVAREGKIGSDDLRLIELAEDPSAVVEIVKAHVAEQVR